MTPTSIRSSARSTSPLTICRWNPPPSAATWMSAPTPTTSSTPSCPQPGRGEAAATTGRPAAVHCALAGGIFGARLQPWRALGAGTAGSTWHPLGIDVPAVNGRTGETMGSVPGQQWKMLLAALTAGTVIEALAILILMATS
ncbi:hypothetical protein G6F63_014209 [Rhizopus arrhizus]|nr:hypothetical protein G6F63_014209 [Rhizopus arrhizus]